jgi:hypothetical protein
MVQQGCTCADCIMAREADRRIIKASGKKPGKKARKRDLKRAARELSTPPGGLGVSPGTRAADGPAPARKFAAPMLTKAGTGARYFEDRWRQCENPQEREQYFQMMVDRMGVRWC